MSENFMILEAIYPSLLWRNMLHFNYHLASFEVLYEYILSVSIESTTQDGIQIFAILVTFLYIIFGSFLQRLSLYCADFINFSRKLTTNLQKTPNMINTRFQIKMHLRLLVIILYAIEMRRFTNVLFNAKNHHEAMCV